MNQQKFNPAVASKRRQKDIMKLLMSEYKVIQSKDSQGDLIVEFLGPKNTLYENGTWQIHVLLPEQYPYKSPSIGFNNKIYHPNVDEGSGSVCLDVINQAWSPMYDLVNVFEQFLPQLLSYPNPTDPLNPDAASLMLKNEQKYEEKVKDYVQKYATKQQPEKQKSQNLKPMNSSGNSTNLFKKDRKLSDLCYKNSSAGGSTDDQIDDGEDDIGNKGISKKRSLDFTKDLLNENSNINQDKNKQEEEQEEDEQVSNISLDDVSELSELSELEMNEEECCY